MAQSSDLERRICLVWKTDKPYLDKLQKSSDFSLLGFEWYLQLKYECENGYYYYTLSLHQGTDKINLEKSFKFSVTTFIESNSKKCLLHSSSKEFSRTDEVLFKYDIGTLSSRISGFENYRKMKFVCFFHDLPPSTLQTKTERAHLSTQTDWGLPPSVNVSPDLDKMCLDFSNLLKDGKYVDVVLRCGDRAFCVHKCILAARCQAIAGKFRKDTRVYELDIIDVTDVDAGVLDLLLKYLYSGKLPDISADNARSLYEAGEIYAIPGLKKASTDWMISHLKENRDCFLTFSVQHEYDAFKDAVLSRINTS